MLKTRSWSQFERLCDAGEWRLAASPCGSWHRHQKDVVDAMRARLDRIENWVGRGHFKTRRLEKVGTEISPHILTYNIKRAITLIVVPGPIVAR